MGKMIEVVGWLVIAGSLGIALFAGSIGKSGIAPFVVAIYLFPVIFSGMLIVAFGRMVTELIAIRTSNERMERHLSTIADRLRMPGAAATPSTETIAAGRQDWQRPY